MSDHVSDLRWDRWLAGELSADEAAAAVAHADGCATCGDRMRALTAGRDAFRDRPIPMTFARARRRTGRSTWIGGAATLVAAAAVVVLVVRRAPTDSTERPKGNGPSFIVAGGPAGALVPLSSGDTIRPGDSIQVGYSSDRDGFGAVISRDGAFAVTAYVPSQGATLVPLPAGVERSFPESTVLDAVVGTETLYILWCDTPRPLAPLLAEVRGGALMPHTDCRQRTIVLEKRAGRTGP